jgi:hypothetical protein
MWWHLEAKGEHSRDAPLKKPPRGLEVLGAQKTGAPPWAYLAGAGSDAGAGAGAAGADFAGAACSISVPCFSPPMSSESPPFMMTYRAKAANKTKATMIFYIPVFLKKRKKGPR